MTRSELRTLATQSGNDIVACFFHPESEPKACVLIVPAMGVAQKFYSPCACWLASQGFLVATFDYSGIGLSRRTDLRRLKVNILDWAKFDCEAMIHAITMEARAKPLYWLGHSLGGQIIGLVPSGVRIAKAVTIACGSGYWLDNAPSLKRKAWWVWYVAVPIATRLLGYFPGKRLRKVGDLPRGVVEQWRRWCLDPHYAVGAEGPEIQAQFEAVKIPITSLSFVDDEFMSLKNTESMHGFYRNAPRTMTRISPTDVGATRIGHFGFFNARFQETLWRRYLLPELTAEIGLGQLPSSAARR
ncbi:MAG TPA: alpha/beta hydrolase [Steroidobacteraceae bacterium]|jgi:predicted alpha/beta hydrolase